MDDTISRQQAIDAVCMEWCGVKHQDCKHPFDAEKDDYYWCDGCETVFQTLPGLPSAEPEKVLIARINLSEEQVREAAERAKNEIVQVLPSAEPGISRIEQKLHGKTPEEQYEVLYWLLLKFGLAYTDSRLAVIEWLRGERNE